MPADATLGVTKVLGSSVGLAGRRGVDEVERLNEVAVGQDSESFAPLELLRVSGAHDNVHAGRLKASLGVSVACHPRATKEIKNSHHRILSRFHNESTQNPATVFCG